MRIRALLAVGALVLGAGPALAQTPAPTTPGPSRAQPPQTGAAGGAHDSEAVDRRFLASEARGSAFELAIAQLAAERATRQDVKDYAARVVSDHESYNAVLRQLASTKGVQLPEGLTRGDEARLARLRGLHGAAFDAGFVAEARRVNMEDQRDGRTEAQRTHDSGVRAFLERFASVDAEHTRMADALRSRR